jgi:hypothetical protein
MSPGQAVSQLQLYFNEENPHAIAPRCGSGHGRVTIEGKTPPLVSFLTQELVAPKLDNFRGLVKIAQIARPRRAYRSMYVYVCYI